MDKETKFGIIVVIVVALIIGAYYLGTSNNSNLTTNSVATTSSTQTYAPVKQVSNNDNLEANREKCSNLLTSFKAKVLDKNNELQGNGAYTSITSSDFVVGYSPSLDSCVGGYTFKQLMGSGNSYVSYLILDPKTNLGLKDRLSYGNDIPMTYENYRKTLDELTSGQISVNNNSIKEDQTSGLQFCNIGYTKCAYGKQFNCGTSGVGNCL